MTIEALAFINTTLNDAGVKYELGEWTSKTVPSPYFVGEFIETTPMNEDGMDETQFILTGTSRKSWLELLESREKVQDLFPAVGGKVAKLSNGSSVAIFYDNSHDVPTDTDEIKRLQINLTVKEWKVK